MILHHNGDIFAYSCDNKEGYNVTIDSQGTNMLTGCNENGGDVYLKMLEVYEIECLDPPK